MTMWCELISIFIRRYTAKVNDTETFSDTKNVQKWQRLGNMISIWVIPSKTKLNSLSVLVSGYKIKRLSSSQSLINKRTIRLIFWHCTYRYTLRWLSLRKLHIVEVMELPFAGIRKKKPMPHCQRRSLDPGEKNGALIFVKYIYKEVKFKNKLILRETLRRGQISIPWPCQVMKLASKIIK